MKYFSYYKSPLGQMLMTSDGDHLLSLDFEDSKYISKDLKNFQEKSDLKVFIQTKRWLDLYFKGQVPDFFPQIKLEGTAFRKKVWERLLEIPYGTSKTYGDLSLEIFANKKYSQALGGAVGHNPISIIVPCHRVLGVDGRLTGYAGGLERKKFLLDLEKIPYRKWLKWKTQIYLK